MTTGERIKKARKKAGLTQKALGQKCQMPDSQIRQYELGMVNPKVETLKRIAYALNVPVTELLEPTVFEINKDILELFTGKGKLELVDDYSVLNNLYDKLNDRGQKKATELVELLTKIPEYQKKD
ncbi:MAG: helix-turn-helix domain-containing protein [Eubacteriales bacterium]|nr:helix-turn-helix domain-containing protein [Eubacteriales bacterium]